MRPTRYVIHVNAPSDVLDVSEIALTKIARSNLVSARNVATRRVSRFVRAVTFDTTADADTVMRVCKRIFGPCRQVS